MQQRHIRTEGNQDGNSTVVSWNSIDIKGLPSVFIIIVPVMYIVRGSSTRRERPVNLDRSKSKANRQVSPIVLGAVHKRRP